MEPITQGQIDDDYLKFFNQYLTLSWGYFWNTSGRLRKKFRNNNGRIQIYVGYKMNYISVLYNFIESGTLKIVQTEIT